MTTNISLHIYNNDKIDIEINDVEFENSENQLVIVKNIKFYLAQNEVIFFFDNQKTAKEFLEKLGDAIKGAEL